MLNQKGVVGILALLILLAGIIAGVYLVLHPQIFKSRAAVEAPVRGRAGDLWADIIIGQPDFTEIIPEITTDNDLYIALGIIVDRTVTPNRMYVYDGGHSRVLGYDLGRCLGLATNPLNCKADIVLGQSDMSRSACNGDSSFQNFPTRAPASSSTLCGMQESQLSITEGGSGSSMAIDSQGNLYVTDFWNSRVLKYNSPFTTDKVAEEVWGQTDFTGNSCNKGNSSPDATTLCFTWGNSNNWTAGVDVDSAGNVWVLDNGNNRLLRFPPGSKTADLVLGQSTFTSRSAGSGLNQLKDPSAVRVNSQGRVYVADKDNSRVLVFEPPFTSGMNARVFSSGFLSPVGVDFDPTEPGRVWIDDVGNNLLKLVDETTGTVVRSIGNQGDGNLLGDATGSVGIDSSGNIFIIPRKGDFAGDILMFAKGFSTNTPTKTFYRGLRNERSDRELSSAVRGVVVADNQLIVADGRLRYWNNPLSLTNSKAEDGIAGVNSFKDHKPGCCLVMKADNNHHLYVSLTGSSNNIEVYQLPLSAGAQPTQTISTASLPLLGGGQLGPNQTQTEGNWGLVPSDGGRFLWVSNQGASRVFRIRDPLTNPVVDIILGQADAQGGQCNRGGLATANTLCEPGSVSFDRSGNLFVSDHSLETRGNQRLLLFRKELLPTDNISVIYGPAASKIFPTTSSWEPAFDSQNHMVIGLNPYFPSINPNGGWFPAYYNDPLSSSTTPDGYIKDYHSMAFGATFDDQDNLYIADLNRGRVLIYKNPFNNPISPTSIPTPLPTPTPTYTTTPSPSSTPTSTPSPTPTPTSTPSPSPTYTTTPSPSSTPTSTPFPSHSPSPTPVRLIGDINTDNRVDMADFNLLVANFGTSGTGLTSDLNSDGKVDIFDYNLLIQNYGQTN